MAREIKYHVFVDGAHWYVKGFSIRDAVNRVFRLLKHAHERSYMPFYFFLSKHGYLNHCFHKLSLADISGEIVYKETFFHSLGR